MEGEDFIPLEHQGITFFPNSGIKHLPEMGQLWILRDFGFSSELWNYFVVIFKLTDSIRMSPSDHRDVFLPGDLNSCVVPPGRASVTHPSSSLGMQGLDHDSRYHPHPSSAVLLGLRCDGYPGIFPEDIEKNNLGCWAEIPNLDSKRKLLMQLGIN